MISNLVKKTKSLLSSLLGREADNVEFDQAYWDQLYSKGRWSFLEQLGELSHYSVLLGYCQYFSSEGSVLEVGCGEGILQQKLAVLPYKKYVGMDVSAVAIDTAKKLKDHRTEFFVADGANFIPEGLFDIMIFNESLYCFNNCLDVLAHYQQFLKPDGVFVISMHVQEVARRHWADIDSHYDVLDAVNIVNKEGVAWWCKAIVKRQDKK